ncbi:ABC transporter permease [Skermania piniformis]|uniref:Transport permease protein n=1 Tax=Skermania pinensis TaxID=39122 RepID=A0ABX8S782_9ACTN|nr:ABC transporter permease [Skermania piniformis]QXQ13331.1 ABC transporter permease [Skermania piniformis]
MNAAPAAPVNVGPATARRSVSLGRHLVVTVATLLRTWSRDPGVVVQTVAFPAFMLLMFQLVLGKTVTAMGGGNSIYGNAGLVALVAAMYGTVATGISLIDDRDSGLLTRTWSLPVPRAGFLAGRLSAEAVRTGLSTVVLFAVAVPLGFRFQHGLLAGLVAIAVPMVFAVGIAVLVVAVATVAVRQTLQQLAGLFLLLLFFNVGFVPITEYPGWLQPVVRHQPMSPAIEAMRGLTEGGAVAAPLLETVAWTIGLVAVSGPVAMRGYRRAAEGR